MSTDQLKTAARMIYSVSAQAGPTGKSCNCIPPLLAPFAFRSSRRPRSFHLLCPRRQVSLLLCPLATCPEQPVRGGVHEGRLTRLHISAWSPASLPLPQCSVPPEGERVLDPVPNYARHGSRWSEDSDAAAAAAAAAAGRGTPPRDGHRHMPSSVPAWRNPGPECCTFAELDL